ncbi:hypothetical protein SCP_0400580 [Sparassis crispa]|uniref:F-box domain-containing protein n=1 Tax=Sparassis crispa TaxID=139825 RepID=A0A401GHM5_9APHY|nr:hypothetical protein SCP_0400580 [Sparassis crispa]GBE81687.1 hypothetical protein SCP_0400580 [Sparassis crispa]
MTAVLPPELFDETIDHLWDDPPSLKACSLTCRSWIPSSRLHLFHTVRLRDSADCERLEALVAASPSITRCVRRLSLSAEYGGVDADGHAWEDDGWVDTAAPLLAQLTRVTTLGLSRIRWDALHPETQSTILRLSKSVRSLFLFEVRFATAYDVLEFLSAFPALEELYFHAVSWAQDSMDTRPDSTALSLAVDAVRGNIRLTYLFLDARSSPTLVTEWLLRHPSEQRLRTIQLCWREIENTKAVGDLLYASGAALEQLQVEFPAGVPEEAVLEDHLSLAANTCLRSLHFGGLNAAQSHSFVSRRLFPWVTGMLAQLRSRRLQEVTFELAITAVRDLLGLDWERIDRELSKEEFAGLMVVFRVSCEDIWGDIREEVRELVTSRLVGFQSKGSLCVSCI